MRFMIANRAQLIIDGVALKVRDVDVASTDVRVRRVTRRAKPRARCGTIALAHVAQDELAAVAGRPIARLALDLRRCVTHERHEVAAQIARRALG